MDNKQQSANNTWAGYFHFVLQGQPMMSRRLLALVLAALLFFTGFARVEAKSVRYRQMDSST
jgi:hypothetical protein